MDRHDWSPQARDQFFGLEPADSDPLPDHAEALEAFRSTLLRAHRACTDALKGNEETSSFLDLLPDRSDEFIKTSNAQPMRVLLLGRTMAGKSTLLAALTGGSSERIGVGGQRTSLDVFADMAVDLQDVEIVDTPGVGAMDGADDVALAMAEVPNADLVLWVASDDSFQEQTAQSLRNVAFQGKPIVIVLNCRAALVDELDREDFLDDPASVFDQTQGHFSTIRSHLASVGVRPIAEVMLHAEAARQSRHDPVFGAELKNASGIEHLLSVLARESEMNRVGRRVMRDSDAIRDLASDLVARLAVCEQQIRESVRLGQQLRVEQITRATRLVNACKQRANDDVVRIIGQTSSWPQTVTEFDDQLANLWEDQQRSLVAQLTKAIESRFSELEREIAVAHLDVEREQSAVAPYIPGLEGLQDFRGLWKRRVVDAFFGVGRVAVGFIGAQLGAIGGRAIAGPIGALIGRQLGGAAPIVIDPIQKKVQSLFKSKAQVLKENRELLRPEIDRILDAMVQEYQREIDAGIDSVRRRLSERAQEMKRVEDDAFDVAEQLAKQRGVISDSIRALDRATVACMLRLDGRPRLASSVERVTRLAGVCIAIEVSDRALTEAWLFPPSGLELMTFGRVCSSKELPGTRAAEYVLGLTERAPKFLMLRADETLVTADSSIPDSVLPAWSATLSDHLNTQVNVIPQKK